MEYLILPISRFDELDGLYDMGGFKQIRRDNLAACREICIVAQENGKLCGEISIMTANANIPAAVIPNRRVYLFGLRVLPEHRGKGVGAALVGEAVKLCASRGIHELTIGAEKSNPRARSLYERLGFAPFLTDCTERPDGKELNFDLLMLRL